MKMNEDMKEIIFLREIKHPFTKFSDEIEGQSSHILHFSMGIMLFQ
jgi:hypothetical protein